MNRGLFISFEGPDGSGKSTQFEFVKKYIQERGIEAVFTREPGGSRIGEEIRKIILNREFVEMDPLTEAFLYASSRAQHVSEIIVPALERGSIVFCDRYVDSSIAYQGYGRNLLETVVSINNIATGGLLPDYTFYFDISPQNSRSRLLGKNKDRLELEKDEFHSCVYEGYTKLAMENSDRYIIVDASDTIEGVSRFVAEKLDEILNGYEK